MRGFIGEKKLDPRFSQKQAVERAMSGISARNMAEMRRMNRNALGSDLDKFHSLAHEKLNTQARCELFKICVEHLEIKHFTHFSKV